MAALRGPFFIDTNLLVHGTVKFAAESGAAIRVMDAAIAGRLGPVGTAWHCCLEFFAVSTRLPAEYRLTPSNALQIIEEDFVPRLEIHDFDGTRRASFLSEVRLQGVVGARIYDTHIAEVARQSGCETFITGNGRHFTALQRHGIRVLTADEMASEIGL